MTATNAMAERAEGYRRELTGYCYRMLGSAFEAEDATQETLVRAWRAADRFEERSSIRTWLYRIATNVCLDALEARGRRALPMDLSAPASGAAGPGEPLDPGRLVEPCPGEWAAVTANGADRPADPAQAAVAGESVRLAFVATLQRLAPKQRATLLLREVMGFSAREVAELHGSTVASVNSALQRARSTLAAHRARADGSAPDALQQALADRYAAAFSRFDMTELGLLLHVDATLSLPPYALWMRGIEDIRAWWSGPAVGCRGSRLLPTVANGVPAFGQYRPAADGSGFEPWALQVVEVSAGRITAVTAFRDTARLFPLFGLPPHVPA